MRHAPIASHVSGYAHPVWLASLGVLGTLQTEGSRLFHDLVKEGRRVEHHQGKEDSLADAVVATKEAYQKKLEAQLKEWDTQLDRLRATATKVQANARTRIDAELAGLKEKRATAQKKLDELRTRGEDAWDDLTDGVEQAWADIGAAFGKALTRFK